MTITTRDGTRLHVTDWGDGPPVVFSHGWPLSADAWEDQMLCLASHGFRCVAHDRRGHGRSTQPWDGNNMDTYADDLAAVVRSLGLRDAVHVGHSTGAGEVARYISRFGTASVSKVVLIGSVTPLMLKTQTNPDGVPMSVFNTMRAGVEADRAQYFRDLSVPFYGANRRGSRVSDGLLDSFWRQGMQAGLKNVVECVAAFSQTDFTSDLRSINRPTLVLHGDDDQMVPVATAARTAALVPGARLKLYHGAPHGLCATSKTELNADLLSFLQA